MPRAEPIFRWTATVAGIIAAAIVVASHFFEYWKLGPGTRAWGIADGDWIGARWAAPAAPSAAPAPAPGHYLRRRGAGGPRQLWIAYAGPAGVTVTIRSITMYPVYPLGLAVVLWAIRFRRVPPGHCKRCRYDLRGLPAGTACPECGHFADAPAPP